MPRTWKLPVVALGLTIAVSALSDDRSNKVRLLETRRGDVNELWVEVVGSEGSPRHLLRQTVEELIPDATGTDPTGRAAFVSWTESASGHWTAYSRDGGASWSRPVQLDLDLRLRAGNVGPNDTTPAVEADLTLPPQGRLFVVQFRTFSLPEWRQALEELGADVVGYFPHHAHVVRMPPSLISSLSSLEFVQRILPYHPAYRLESALKAWRNWS